MAGELRLEQCQKAFLRILPRLRPLIAQGVEAGPGLDPGKVINDVRYDRAHGLLTFRLLTGGFNARGRRAFRTWSPASASREPGRLRSRSAQSTAGYLRAVDRLSGPGTRGPLP